jgi:hypothetical protein
MIGLMEQRPSSLQSRFAAKPPLPVPLILTKGNAGVLQPMDEVSTSPLSDDAAARIVWLNCIHCGGKIARSCDRIEVNSKHEHTFINPAGVIYRIGCFSASPGAFEIGQASSEFAWFRGYVWRCLCCASCEIHLGWTFVQDAALFCGLILDQLSEGGADAD